MQRLFCMFVCLYVVWWVSCLYNKQRLQSKSIGIHHIKGSKRERERERVIFQVNCMHGSPKTGSMNSRAGSSAAQERIYIKLEIHTLRVRQVGRQTVRANHFHAFLIQSAKIFIFGKKSNFRYFCATDRLQKFKLKISKILTKLERERDQN